MNTCISEFNGIICGKPCRNKYCSRRCNNRAWKKSKTFLNKKCKECKKPCSNKYCSRKCAAKSMTNERKEICLTCGGEFTYNNIGYKKRGGAKYCSLKCSASNYFFNDFFFKRPNDVESTYEILGFVFSNGVIDDYSRFEITLNADKILLQNFAIVAKTTYPIKEIPIRGKTEKIYRMTFRNQETINYLHSIGFTHNLSIHEFPCILPEYRKYFIRGFLNSPNCCVFEKDDHNMIVVVSKSYHIIRTISDIMGVEIITKKLEYCCVFKDYTKFYIKNMLQMSHAPCMP